MRLTPVSQRGRVRLLVDLPPEDARRYRIAVAGVAPAIERALGKEVRANRCRSVGEGFVLDDWRAAWAKFASDAADLARHRGVLVVTDVRRFFPSIRPTAVERALGGLGVGAHAVGAVTGLLRDLEERGVPGLPIGPPASPVLANAVLAPADAALRATGARHLRWVDDVLAVVSPSASPWEALDALMSSLRPFGLELSEPKTRVTGDPDEALALARKPPSRPTYNRGA